MQLARHKKRKMALNRLRKDQRYYRLDSLHIHRLRGDTVMKKYALAFAWVGVAAVPLLNAAPAAAQLDHTYVTQTGGGSICSFASPCNVVQTAIGQTNPGGDVYILNGDYTENIIIDRAISITGDLTAGVIIRATTTNGTSTTVTVNAPSNANVSLSNLSIYPDLNGITFNTGRRLNINAGTSATGASNLGLNFIPNTAASSGPTRLTVNGSSISGRNGDVLIKPTSGVAVDAFLNNLRMSGSVTSGAFGIRVDNSGGSGAITVDFQNGWANTHVNNGFLAVGTGAAPVKLVVDHSTADSNGAFGSVATGANATLTVTASALINNGTGLGQLGSATVNTLQNNVINLNTTPTSGTITSIPLQ
jgi:hypothetical protein